MLKINFKPLTACHKKISDISAFLPDIGKIIVKSDGIDIISIKHPNIITNILPTNLSNVYFQSQLCNILFLSFTILAYI